MKTAYILVRHLELHPEVTQHKIGGGQFVRIVQNASGRQHLIELERCHELFPFMHVFFTDWVYKKSYPVTPPARSGHDPSDFVGDIPDEAEDLLLTLRLVQPGDISFVAQALVGEDGDLRSQLPYRYFSSIASTHPYRFDPDLIPLVQDLLQLVRQPAANSEWFSVAKRFFLYGGAKEFNPNPAVKAFDRILDFAIALEAVLVFESESVSKLLRRRAIGLLELQGDPVKPIETLLNNFYGYRSTIAHGEPLDAPDPAGFHCQMWEFEKLVRRVLKTALKVIPAGVDARKNKLEELSTIDDSDRVASLVASAQRLQDASMKERVLAALRPERASEAAGA